MGDKTMVWAGSDHPDQMTGPDTSLHTQHSGSRSVTARSSDALPSKAKRKKNYATNSQSRSGSRLAGQKPAKAKPAQPKNQPDLFDAVPSIQRTHSPAPPKPSAAPAHSAPPAVRTSSATTAKKLELSQTAQPDATTLLRDARIKPLPGNPVCVSVNQALLRYGVGRTKLYELLSGGVLRARKLGTKTLIEVEPADAYFASLPSFRQ